MKGISVQMENNKIESLSTNLKPILDKISLFPKLLPVLSNSVLADKKFPTNNIAFNLFQCRNTVFNKEATQFWSLGYKLCKDQLLRFMWVGVGGEKVQCNAMNVNECSKLINFVIPDRNILQKDIQTQLTQIVKTWIN